jgi:energy-coupling factor transporter ATP-binding protein EcfA2
MIYWFTGQPGSGKTVLANLLKEKALPHAYRIDGDEMRELFDNKDYSIKGIFVHYSNRIRGREEYHVLGYQNPQFNFVDIDTSDDSPKQSLDIIREELKI